MAVLPSILVAPVLTVDMRHAIAIQGPTEERESSISIQSTPGTRSASRSPRSKHRSAAKRLPLLPPPYPSHSPRLPGPHLHSPAAAADRVRQVRAASEKPEAVNLVPEWDATRHVHVCIEAGARVFSFFWGVPPHLDRIHSADGIVDDTVGPLTRPRAADAAVT